MRHKAKFMAHNGGKSRLAGDWAIPERYCFLTPQRTFSHPAALLWTGFGGVSPKQDRAG